MRRRTFCMLAGSGLAAAATGCRNHQYAHVLKDDQQDMVGSHQAGAETFNPLVTDAVAQLLGRCSSAPIHRNASTGTVQPMRICFLCVENKSAEELGDFREQLYQQIDSQISQSPEFQPISRRFVDAGLRESRLHPDGLFIPANMRVFTGVMEQMGQPFDYLMYATLTSGTTQNNKSYQRDYTLTLEVVHVQSGAYDKQLATVRKGYHKSRVGKWAKYNPLTNG